MIKIKVYMTVINIRIIVKLFHNQGRGGMLIINDAKEEVITENTSS